MKTRSITPETAATEIDLAQAVKDAIENAPSRAALEAEKDKLKKIESARQVAAREVDQLVDQLAKSRKSEGNSSALDKILSGRASDATLKLAGKLGEARANLDTIEAVVRNQIQKVSELQRSFSIEVNRAVRSSRAPFVKRIAAALAELKAACQEEIETRESIARNGVDLNALDNFGYLPVMGDSEWLAARRKQGFAV